MFQVARMFVQDVNVLPRVVNRSLIKDITARDLEAGIIEAVLGRLEEAVRQEAMHAKKPVAVPLRSAERICELRIKKRREKARSQRRQENRSAEMATA